MSCYRGRKITNVKDPLHKILIICFLHPRSAFIFLLRYFKANMFGKYWVGNVKWGYFDWWSEFDQKQKKRLFTLNYPIHFFDLLLMIQIYGYLKTNLNNIQRKWNLSIESNKEIWFKKIYRWALISRKLRKISFLLLGFYFKNSITFFKKAANIAKVVVCATRVDMTF